MNDNRRWKYVEASATITGKQILESMEASIKRIKERANEPERYWTRCQNCGRLVLALAYIKVEQCPMCEIKNNKEAK